MLTNISLFSGCGGLDSGAKILGGFKTIAKAGDRCPVVVLVRSKARKSRRAEKCAQNEALSLCLDKLVEACGVSESNLCTDGPKRATGKPGALKRKKPKRKKSPTLSKLKKLLWAQISQLVRSWSAVCLACGIRPTECAAHIVPSNEGAATRFFLPNLYPCCQICNGLEKWNRASWVYHHREMFGDDHVDALYAYSDTMFQVKKHWVLEQSERMRKLLGASL